MSDNPAMSAEDAEDVLLSSCARYLSHDSFNEAITAIKSAEWRSGHDSGYYNGRNEDLTGFVPYTNPHEVKP